MQFQIVEILIDKQFDFGYYLHSRFEIALHTVEVYRVVIMNRIGDEFDIVARLGDIFAFELEFVERCDHSFVVIHKE